MTCSWRPPHAYVPGRTARHPEGLFDDIKSGLDGIPAHRMHETRAWACGLMFYRDGYFWEAHEVLEAVWMACPPNSPEKLMVQGVIQRVNAELKLKMGQERAANRLFEISGKLCREAVERAGQDILRLDMYYNALNAPQISEYGRNIDE
ncbi:conserved domain protein [Rhodobacteraceae bacterium KLH11]|nr:conserved domain protein [Rhodobacteraceae bacterium KLH11]